jgi:hypothetical protein
VKEAALGGWQSSNWLILVFLITSGLPGFAETTPEGKTEPNLEIRVRVYDYGYVKPTTLVEAEKEAKKILGKAGVETVWLNCYVANVPRDPACNQSLHPADVSIRIIREPKAAFHNKCGVAMGPVYAVVVSSCIAKLAQALYLSRALSLAYLLAHEIGHLLLPAGHSQTGIMSSDFSRVDWHHARRGLAFTGEQSQRMRAALLVRLGGQELVRWYQPPFTRAP